MSGTLKVLVDGQWQPVNTGIISNETMQWNAAWGRVASFVNSTDFVVGAVETSVCGGQFTAVAGRRYQFVTKLALIPNVSGSDQFGILAKVDTVQMSYERSAMLGGWQTFNAPSGTYDATTGGTKQALINVVRTTGSGTCTVGGLSFFPTVIDIYDVGPIGAAPAPPAPVWSGPESGKPTIPGAGQRYFATDTKRDWLYDGAGWVIMGEPRTSWTPTFSAGVTVGSGVGTGYLHRSDGFCDIAGQFMLGAGSAITGHISLRLPFPAYFLTIEWLRVGYADGNLYWPGLVGDQADPGLYPLTASNQYVQITGILGPAIPFTWSAGDYIQFSGRYQMASRYT